MSSLTLQWAIVRFLHPFYTFSPTHPRVSCGTFILIFLGFSVTFTTSAMILSWRFLPTDVFYLKLLSHILSRFCDSDAGRNTPSRIILCVCPHRVVPSAWHMVLNYSYCRYKTIDLTIVPVRHKVKLLNIFQPTYACLKTTKTLWTRLVLKYCLKLLQQNCFLSIHQS